MDEISVPKHLLIPVLICLLCLIITIYKRNEIIFKSSKNLFIAILVFLSLYLLLVGNALFYDIYYKWNLNQYDVDKNGMFSGNEINENQKIAINKLTGDTARKFSFIVGLIFSSIFSLFLYLVLTLISKVKRKFKKREGA